MITKDDLQNRDGGKGHRDHPVNGDGSAEKLAAIKERMKEIRAVTLPGQNKHCEDCFTRGVAAALKFVAGEGEA